MKGLLAAVVGVSLAGAVETNAVELRKLLKTRVTWLDTQGTLGEMMFQGTVDEEGNLDGIAYPGDGTEFIVTGIVTSDGFVTGSFDDAEHQHIGTFTAELNAQRELVGELVVSAEPVCEFEAPADALPVE
jgi:hypothetical protein